MDHGSSVEDHQSFSSICVTLQVYFCADVGEVAWIQSLPVDTYREESILLVQLKNTTIIVLSWNGRGFERIALPNIELRIHDLSAITVIPRYGFIYDNLLVKIDTRLEDKPRPVRDEMEKMLQIRRALAVGTRRFRE